MRTWGRITDPITRKKSWVMVQPDAAGHQDMVWLTTLCQVLQLSPGESPFYANYGVPVQRAIITQLFPDYYVNLTQQLFADYFAALTVQRVTNYLDPATRGPGAFYQIDVTTNVGVSLEVKVAT